MNNINEEIMTRVNMNKNIHEVEDVAVTTPTNKGYIEADAKKAEEADKIEADRAKDAVVPNEPSVGEKVKGPYTKMFNLDESLFEDADNEDSYYKVSVTWDEVRDDRSFSNTIVYLVKARDEGSAVDKVREVVNDDSRAYSAKRLSGNHPTNVEIKFMKKRGRFIESAHDDTKKFKFKVYNISWSVEPEDFEDEFDEDDFANRADFISACENRVDEVIEDLPGETIVEIEDTSDIEDGIADALSEEYGWLVNSFDYDDITEESITEERFTSNDENGLPNRIVVSKDELNAKYGADIDIALANFITDKYGALVDAFEKSLDGDSYIVTNIGWYIDDGEEDESLKRDAVDDLTVYNVAMERMFPEKSGRWHICDDIDGYYSYEDYKSVPGEDYSIGLEFKTDNELTLAKAVADTFGLDFEVKEFGTYVKEDGKLKRAMMEVAIIHIPDDIANKKYTEVIKESVNEDLKLITDISSFEPWSGAIDTWEKIEHADKISELDEMLDELYPDGMTVTDLNDLLWYDSEWILDSLGISGDDGDDDGIEESKEPMKYHIVLYHYPQNTSEVIHNDNNAWSESDLKRELGDWISNSKEMQKSIDSGDWYEMSCENNITDEVVASVKND